MNISKKNVLIISASLLSILVLWSGLSFYSVGKIASELELMVSQPDPKSSFRFKNLQHQPGFLSSKGDVLVTVVDKHGDGDTSDPNTPWMQVQYEMSHLILPFSLARFEWRLQPQLKDKPNFEKIFPKDFALTGNGAIGLGGSYSSTFLLPAFEIAKADSLLNVASTQGFVKSADKFFKFNLSNDKINYRGSNQSLQLDSLGISMEMTNTQNGIGSSGISIQKISTSSATLEGFKIAAESVVSQQKLDVRLTQSLLKASFMNQTLSNLQAEWIVGGLHDQSTDKLIQLMDATQGFRKMTAEEDQLMRQAIKAIFLNGWKLGLSKLNAETEGGNVKGQLMLEFEPDVGGQLNFEKNLKLNGEFKINGKLLTAEQQDTLVKLGMAVKTAEGLQATVNLAQGKLKLNGKDNETVGVQADLRKEQTLFEAFLSGSSSEKNIGSSPVVPEIEGEEGSQEPSSPPAVAPPEKPAE